MEWVTDTCNRFKVDKLLIEAKASGISAARASQPLCIPAVGNSVMLAQGGQARASLGSAAGLLAGDGLRT
jgi:hypothetical protein